MLNKMSGGLSIREGACLHIVFLSVEIIPQHMAAPLVVLEALLKYCAKYFNLAH